MVYIDFLHPILPCPAKIAQSIVHSLSLWLYVYTVLQKDRLPLSGLRKVLEQRLIADMLVKWKFCLRAWVCHTSLLVHMKEKW